MQVDFAANLGRDDETLEMPWSSSDGKLRYYDVKRQPGLLSCIEEAGRVAELREFLRAVNSRTGILETAKCDAWSSREMNPEEAIFGAAWKFGSYVDLLFSEEQTRFSFPEHEQLARHLTELLKRVPEIPASAELLVRRCYYLEKENSTKPREGFYITFYLFGYGEDEKQARQQWGIALKLGENAIRQISALRRKSGG